MKAYGVVIISAHFSNQGGIHLRSLSSMVLSPLIRYLNPGLRSLSFMFMVHIKRGPLCLKQSKV